MARTKQTDFANHIHAQGETNTLDEALSEHKNKE